MSFCDVYVYRTHTPAQFNMCNGTYLGDHRTPARFRPDPGIKKIALDPAESSAIDGV